VKGLEHYIDNATGTGGNKDAKTTRQLLIINSYIKITLGILLFLVVHRMRIMAELGPILEELEQERQD
jgi:hypothetical protein